MKRPQKIRAWLESLLQSSPDPHLLLTREGRIKYVNPAALVAFAAETGDMAGSLVDRWIPDYDLAGLDGHEIECEGVSGAGDRFPIEYTVTAVDDESGHIWVVVRDIQKRKGFEGSIRNYASELEKSVQARTREIAELHDRWTNAYDTAPILDMELDSEGNIASVNRKACLALGTMADRLIGLSLPELAAPDHRAPLEEAMRGVAERATAPFETQLRGAGGTPVDVIFHPVYSDGTARKARLFGLDVTARREAERLVDQSMELAEAQRARMERILRGIGDAVVVTDPDGQVRLMNDAAEQMLRVNQHLAFGRDLFSEQGDAEFVAAWQEFLAGGEGDVCRIPFQRDELQVRHFEVTISRIRTDEGRIAACAAVIHDVTRRRSETRLKRDFLANITNELRTPMMSIRTLASTLLRDSLIRDEADRRALHSIEHDAGRLQTRLEDLLTMTRLDAGREKPSYRVANIVDLMKEGCSRWGPAAAERGITLDIRADAEGDGVFDPEKMRRVVDRLLANAIGATPQGGRVTLYASREGNQLHCAVEDSGSGMDEARIRRSLDPFSTAAIPGMPESPGLGTYIVRRLVELHGGVMTAESDGQGTTFHFRFPTAPPSKTDPADKREAVTEREAVAASAPSAHADALIDDDDDVPPPGGAPPGDPLVDDPA